MAEAIAHPPIEHGWLKSRNYDLLLIRTTTLLALASGWVVVTYPMMLPLVLLLDLWLLGYHHVISTFTRLVFDPQSRREHRFLIFGLPVLVLAGTFLLGWGIGVWAIASLYLYWQWFHYTRQSWGISKAYDKKSGGHFTASPRAAALTFYLLPVYGILYRSWQAPDKFLFVDLKVVPTPGLLVDVVGIAALLAVLYWAWQQYLAWRAGTLARPHAYYMLSHFIVFFVGYRLIEDITQGWLVINIWHNAQYILFVWLFNNKRFQGRVDPSARLLSWLSQSSHKLFYLLFCVGLSTAIYASIVAAIPSGGALVGVPVAMLIYQAINFHHYVVDAVIWKMRKAPIREALELDRP